MLPFLFAYRVSCTAWPSGYAERALAHMDRAVEMALADGLYGTLTEYVRHFDGLLEGAGGKALLLRRIFWLFCDERRDSF